MRTRAVKAVCTGPHPQFSESKIGEGEMCISSKFPGDAMHLRSILLTTLLETKSVFHKRDGLSLAL